MAGDRLRSGDLVVKIAGLTTPPIGITPGETKGMVQTRDRRYGSPPDSESFPVIWSNGSWTWETPRTVYPTSLTLPAGEKGPGYASTRGDR